MKKRAETEVTGLRIALVDDEQIYLDEMAEICREFAEENHIDIEIYEFSDGGGFLSTEKDFSVVFMDIYMDGSDGVLTAKKLRERDNSCLLIFMTTSTEHMPEAFSCHAFEYIVKPLSPQRVKEVLNDAVRLLPTTDEYAELYCDKINIRVALSEIVYAVTDAHYLDVALSDGTALRCRMTMKQFLGQTNDNERFILINKGIIVNADYITDFENNCCILENGARLPIRVRDRLKIEQMVRNHNFDKIRKKQRYGG